MREGHFEIVACETCLSHFDSRHELNLHKKQHESKSTCRHREDGLVHCSTCDKDTAAKRDDLSKEGGSSFHLGDKDFAEGGTVFTNKDWQTWENTSNDVRKKISREYNLEGVDQ